MLCNLKIVDSFWIFYSWTFKSTAWNPLYNNDPHFSLLGGSYLGGSSKHKNSVSIKGKPGNKAQRLLGFMQEFDKKIQEFSRTSKGLK